MKNLAYLLILCILASCGPDRESNKITDSRDYEAYLDQSNDKTTSKYYELWNDKIKPDSLQLLSFAVVAQENSRYFQNTGNIDYLKKAEQALTKAVDIAAINKSGYLRALARNYISQHRFKEALKMAQLADDAGGGKIDTQSLYFDVHMELGNYELAKSYLDSLANYSHFGYLIRLAKWHDHEGELNRTISLMEKAKITAERSKDKSLMLWSYTNLGDYYGHAGKIATSYDYYLKALVLDPGNAYAKKGIAWIVYSHEKNPDEALRIINAVTRKNQSPDFYLLTAEINDFKKNQRVSKANLAVFDEVVNKKDYGRMYDFHKAELYLGELHDPEKALELAKQEVEERPTPETYSLLSYAYLKNGEPQKALEIVQQYVDGKSGEPNILLRSAEIYKASGSTAKLGEIKEELVAAAFEIGPLAFEKLQRL